MGVLVQKFGGTSVESYEKMDAVCEIIKTYKDQEHDLVIVVSAMGRKGAPYATDTLIGLCNEINKSPKKRELDLLMSCGEIVSGTILVNMLEAKGIESVFLTGRQAGLITSKNFSNAKILNIDPKRIQQELDYGKVVVVAGFQGGSEDGEITTLGRGGSDTSAVAIGKSLGCDTVEIYTDVDGIMTADPRVEPEAKVLDFIDYEEVFQMADKGAKVIHPRAVQLAKNGDITLVIKNTLNPSCPGTKIGSIYKNSQLSREYEQDLSFMTSVANKDKIAQVSINAEEGVFTEILNKLEENNISIDMINFFISQKVFVVEESDIELLESIFSEFNIEYEIRRKCAKVTIIGSKITGIPGIMAKIVRSLSRSGISLLQTSDSSMTISCLVDDKDMVDTVRAIHQEFYIDERIGSV